ncbi:MAG: polymer-forming cytoskeletal protein [Candidatus Pristimantibacillus lignocellulolyticus]|uniref:Polymer-forming cytoskeletal protein n=1 Tax=Candidatus Pristimantibacillus lignocellulolyticus TaxID=2994561 RepID=A0A9J6ZG90_9BACL|nr:MAG: polymer-forming cytoskeletal protein [Candidatus Pristimantibacillus lignocellulolyticus]
MFKETKRLTATDTLIGQGTIFEGSIQTEANLRIEGEFHGDITSQSEIIIGEYGVAKAEIKCLNLTIAGQLQGDVTVTGRLIITPSGQLVGNAIVQSIIVQEGANFNGECKMIGATNKVSTADVESINKNLDNKAENRKAKQAG